MFPIEQLLAAFQLDVRGDMYQKMTHMLRSAKDVKNYDNKQSYVFEVEKDGGFCKLDKPSGTWAHWFINGKDVREKYLEMFGKDLPENYSMEGHWEFFNYNPSCDVFAFYSYPTHSGTVQYFRSILMDTKYEADEVIVTVANIYSMGYSHDENFEYTHFKMYKDSGLPILNRHFSEESHADGRLTVSELIKDQYENLDIYEVRGKKNEWGTYTLVSYDYISDIHMPEEDVIFYNYYNMNNGMGTNAENVFLPLFDCSLCFDANREMFGRGLNYPITFYEDDKYAVIFMKRKYQDYERYGSQAFVLDKTNMTYNAQYESELTDKLIEANPQLSKDGKFVYFEMNGESYLAVSGNRTIPAIIKISE